MRSKVAMFSVILALVFLFTCSAYAEFTCEDVSGKCPLKSICVVKPKLGDVLVSNTTYTVEVKIDPAAFPTNDPVKSYKLQYSLNNGAPGTWKYIGIRNCAPESNCYACFPWVVPVVGETKNECRVRVVASDARGKKVGSDQSAKFTIQPTAGVPECNDGLDNDHDGFTDYPVDPDCSSASDNSEAL